jgi:hypothetical protein
MTEDRIRARIGPPQSVTGKYLGYCLTSGGSLLIGHPGSATTGHAHAVILLTTSRAFALRGRQAAAVRVGTPQSALRKAFPKAQAILHAGRMTIVGLPNGHGTRAATGLVVVAIAHGHVTYLGTYDPRALRTKRALAAFLKSLP